MLTGRFNSFLEHTLVVGVEEALWGGQKADAGIVKNVITSPTLRVERKGLESYDARNYARFIFTSNEDWLLHAGPQARRFFVLEVQNDRANDPAYFDPIFDELESGGVAAFLFDMLRRKITRALNRPPLTNALAEQRRLSLSPVERWALEVAQAGYIEFAKRDGTVKKYKIAAGQRVPCERVRDAAGKHLNSHQRERLDHELGRLLLNRDEGLGCKRVKTTIGYAYEFPDLDEFRARCAKRFKVTVEGFDGIRFEAGTGVRAKPWLNEAWQKFIASLHAIEREDAKSS